MRLGTVEVQFADHLVVEPYRDSGHTGHARRVAVAENSGQRSKLAQ
jgi:hypothetical protein